MSSVAIQVVPICIKNCYRRHFHSILFARLQSKKKKNELTSTLILILNICVDISTF